MIRSLSEYQAKFDALKRRGFHSWLRENDPELFEKWASERGRNHPDGLFYWRKLHPGVPDPVCVCGGPVNFGKARFNKYCSKTCRSNDPDLRQRTIQTNIRRYGGTSPAASKIIRRKMERTFKANYGDLGGRHPDIVRKREKTCMAKYGVRHSSMDAEVSKKRRENAYLRKTVVFNGKELRVQGAEGIVIRDLATRSSVIDIYTEVAPIPYGLTEIDWGMDVYDKSSRYFCDLEILENQGRRSLVEVKSKWYLDLDYDRNLAKFFCATRHAQEYGNRFVLAIVHKGRVHYITSPTHKKIQRAYKIMEGQDHV